MGEQDIRGRKAPDWLNIGWGTVFGTGFGIVATYFLSKEAKDRVDSAAGAVESTVHRHVLQAGLWLFLALVITGVVIAIIRTRNLLLLQGELKGQKDQVKDLQDEICTLRTEKERLEKDAGRNKKEVDRRWETYKTIEYGHMKYEPFLYYKGGSATGLGVELLKELLTIPDRGTRIHAFKDERDWSSILEGLVKGEYDVVATPLFATFERSKEVRFTSPLFFSNVGLYVSKAVSDLDVWKNLSIGTLKTRIEEAGESLKSTGGLRFLAVKGEISYKLANKYRLKESTNVSIEELPGSTLPSSLFERIADSKSPNLALFCESFSGDNQPQVSPAQVLSPSPKVEPTVTNVLRPHQILYPVCFAVRLGDYHLSNLLNIRLLKLTEKGGALPLLAKQLANESNLSEEEVKKHFVNEWPDSGDGKKYA